jgi:hypothetical protein
MNDLTTMDEWIFETRGGEETSLSALKAEFPDLVAYDDSGRSVDLHDEASFLHDVGEDETRVLFWENEKISEDDFGFHAVAQARWRKGSFGEF